MGRWNQVLKCKLVFGLQKYINPTVFKSLFTNKTPRKLRNQWPHIFTQTGPTRLKISQLQRDVQSRQPPLLSKNSSKRWRDCQQSDKPGESALRNVACLFWQDNIKEAVFILRRMHNADFSIHYRTLFSLMKTRRALISSRLISVRCLMK